MPKHDSDVKFLCVLLLRCLPSRYVGGETRLVGLKRSHSYSGFLQQLSKATSAVWDEVSTTGCFKPAKFVAPVFQHLTWYTLSQLVFNHT